jgi:hypothetical protein
MKIDTVKTNEVVEGFIRYLVVDAKADPLAILCGVHNAFSHGEILSFLDYDLGKKDKHLRRFYHGIDIAIESLKKMQN